ncbi:hypothetical protein SAMN05444172_1576 [Burkholderia sp. GAS332]|nr:hypothetical protein SAMN05444172_1576 [Burkholderia sp. GAS332]
MQQNDQVKAVRACAAYARHAAVIKALGGAIHKGLGGCRSKERDGDGNKVTHLSKALRMSVTEEDTGERRRLQDDEVMAAIGRCTHCRAAFNAIKARKSARRSLGAAKRSIGVIGRRAAA